MTKEITKANTAAKLLQIAGEKMSLKYHQPVQQRQCHFGSLATFFSGLPMNKGGKLRGKLTTAFQEQRKKNTIIGIIIP